MSTLSVVLLVMSTSATKPYERHGSKTENHRDDQMFDDADEDYVILADQGIVRKQLDKTARPRKQFDDSALLLDCLAHHYKFEFAKLTT